MRPKSNPLSTPQKNEDLRIQMTNLKWTEQKSKLTKKHPAISYSAILLQSFSAILFSEHCSCVVLVVPGNILDLFTSRKFCLFQMGLLADY